MNSATTVSTVPNAAPRMGGVDVTAAVTTYANSASPTKNPRNAWLLLRRMNWSKTTGDRFDAVCWTATSSTEKVIEVTVTRPVAIALSVDAAASLPMTWETADRIESRTALLFVSSARIETTDSAPKASTTAT